MKTAVMLSLEEAYRQGFTPTPFAKLTKRTSGRGKTIYRDPQGREIGQGQLLNQIRDEHGDAKGNVPKIGLETVKEPKGLFIVVEDEAKLSKVTYGRLDDGTPNITIK